MSQTEAIVRPARSDDAERIALLSKQLGYAVTPQAAQERLSLLESDPEHFVFVADLLNTPVVGWVHVCIVATLVTGRQAAIHGLVVRDGDRGRGIGRLLLQQAEQWARKQGCSNVIVRSNALREQAHRFYEKASYLPLKTQLVFVKSLDHNKLQ